jgi:glycerol-3-phosphate dehydrogenase subunit B
MSKSGGRYDLFVIGAGMAGIAAALFAARRGLSVGMAGASGGMVYASGCLDLMAVLPAREHKIWDEPFEAVRALTDKAPEHPLGRAGEDAARESFVEFINFALDCGLEYTHDADRNSRVPTVLGTVKTTFALPGSMSAAAEAMAGKWPALLVGFRGLKGFSPRQIAQNLGRRWPGLKTLKIEFPGFEHLDDYFCEQISQALERPENRDALAEALRPHVSGLKAVGLPAVLGVYRCAEILEHLEEALDASVFEIPTMPPGIAGIRLREHLLSGLKEMGVDVLPQKRILEAEHGKGGVRMRAGVYGPETEVEADAAVLASGRFLGRGLRAGRTEIVEPLFGLRVHQPEARNDWHRQDFFAPEGHPVNRAGLEIDDSFRPLDEHGRPAEGLFAAGSVLAHQDWMREKCGSGLALATAYRAVKSAVDEI